MEHALANALVACGVDDVEVYTPFLMGMLDDVDPTVDEDAAREALDGLAEYVADMVGEGVAESPIEAAALESLFRTWLAGSDGATQTTGPSAAASQPPLSAAAGPSESPDDSDMSDDSDMPDDSELLSLAPSRVTQVLSILSLRATSIGE